MLILDYDYVGKTPGYFRINEKTRRSVDESGARETQVTSLL
jgi:hypothetical protein